MSEYPTEMSKYMNNTTAKKEPALKYRIREFLNKVEYKHRAKAKKDIAYLLGVSERTLERKMFAAKTDKQEISAGELFLLSGYFSVEPKQLMNFSEKELVLPVALTG